MNETFEQVVERVVRECTGKDMPTTDVIKEIMRAIAKKLDEDAVRPKRRSRGRLSAAELRAELRARLRPGYDGYECLKPEVGGVYPEKKR